MPGTESGTCIAYRDAMVLICKRDGAVPVGKKPRGLAGPGAAAVGGVINGSSSGAAHQPTGVDVHEGHAAETISCTGILRSPGGTAVNGAQNGSSRAHDPARVCVDEVKRVEIVARPAILRHPGGAAVNGVKNGSGCAYCKPRVGI